MPRFHSADQVAGEFRVSGPNKQTYDPFKIVVIFEHQKNRLFRIEHPAGPNGEDWYAADVERASNMTAAECEHAAYNDEYARFFVDRVFERLGWKTGNEWKISKHFRSCRVHFFHDRIVMRDWRRGVDCEVGEAFRVSELQEFIEFPLVADGAAQPRPNVGSAWGAGAVIRINHHVIRQVQIKIPQCVELLFCELFGVFLAQQVGTPG